MNLSIKRVLNKHYDSLIFIILITWPPLSNARQLNENIFKSSNDNIQPTERNHDKESDAKVLMTKRQVFQAGTAFGPGGCFPPAASMIGCAPPVPAALPPPAFPALAPPPLAAPAPPPPPVPAGRLIPQALPGAPCEPGVECTGGSVCSRGICLCPPELVQEGTVCVSRTIYGVPPPSGIAPPPPPPPAFAAFNPIAAPIPFYSSQGPLPIAPILSASPCTSGFSPAFAPGYGGCAPKRNAGASAFSVDVADSEEQVQK